MNEEKVVCNAVEICAVRQPVNYSDLNLNWWILVVVGELFSNFRLNYQTNRWSDRDALKRLLIERYKSFRTVCRLIKFNLTRGLKINETFICYATGQPVIDLKHLRHVGSYRWVTVTVETLRIEALKCLVFRSRSEFRKLKTFYPKGKRKLALVAQQFESTGGSRLCSPRWSTYRLSLGHLKRYFSVGDLKHFFKWEMAQWLLKTKAATWHLLSFNLELYT